MSVVEIETHEFVGVLNSVCHQRSITRVNGVFCLQLEFLSGLYRTNSFEKNY